ncbi:MAG: DUF3796 domain-containing protein [Firmicutes bacterium]|nr:DUF3796 domain-containing protein [Bacillota bacterium]
MVKRICESWSKIGWLGFLGFLGFLGSAKSYSGEPQYIFFAFFGFFSYFFVGRMAREIPDERMMQSYQRAGLSTLRFYTLLLASLFAFVILNNNAFHIQYVSMKVIELVVAVVFAFSLILRSFLVYYYDRVE